METTPKIFGDLVRTYRGSISLRKLAEQIGTPYSHISAIENARRSAGGSIAKKLADAFELKGTERADFLQAAKVTSMTNRPSTTTKRKGRSDDLIFKYIKMLSGIEADEIADVVLPNQSPYDMIVTLRDESVMGIELKLAAALLVKASSAESLPSPDSIRPKDFGKAVRFTVHTHEIQP